MAASTTCGKAPIRPTVRVRRARSRTSGARASPCRTMGPAPTEYAHMVDWDMTVCHTYYGVGYQQGNVGDYIWDAGRWAASAAAPVPPDRVHVSLTAGQRLTAARPSTPARLARVFESLSDRLTGVLSGLRGKGRLTDADIDATTREIRLALLEADVSLPVVRAFVARIKERATGRGGLRRAEPGPAGRQDRQRRTHRHPRRPDPPAGVRQDPADRGDARGPAGLR